MEEMSGRGLILWRPKSLHYCLLSLMVCSAGARLRAAESHQIVLSNEYWSVSLVPRTLEMSAELPGGDKLLLSKGQPDLGPIGDIVKDGPRAQWHLEAKGIEVQVWLEKWDLSVQFFSDKIGVFTWPVLHPCASFLRYNMLSLRRLSRKGHTGWRRHGLQRWRLYHRFYRRLRLRSHCSEQIPLF